jgi:hypothetical protein
LRGGECIQAGLEFGHLFPIINLTLGVTLLLHLALDFGVAFCFGLLFLAGPNAQGECGEERKWQRSFHTPVGPDWSRVIRNKTASRHMPVR